MTPAQSMIRPATTSPTLATRPYPASMPRLLRIALTIAIALTGLTIAGIGIGYLAAAGNNPSPNPATIATVDVECVNITRAYNAWATNRITTAWDFETITEAGIRDEIDDQQRLLAAVEGYTDQPAKELTAAVATLGAQLATVNAQLTITGEVTADQAEQTADAHQQVRAAYAAWRTTTCRNDIP